jgi:aldehyde dehydrogenase (NAD+)
VVEPFIEKLVAKAEAIKVGNGLAKGIEMGPVVSRQQLDSNLKHIEDAICDGANIAWGGQHLLDGEYLHGLFMQPAILTEVQPKMRLACEEVFGPVVAVIAVDNFDQALSVANGVEAGLSASIVTRDIKKAMTYAERIESGVVKINQISTGLALQAPFGGVKKSSTDSFKEQGVQAIEFYTRLKTVYLDYSV